MQRTDFLMLSDALRAARNIATATRDTQAVRGVELAAVTLAGSLAAHCGPRFDQARFLADAGVSHAAETVARREGAIRDMRLITGNYGSDDPTGMGRPGVHAFACHKADCKGECSCPPTHS